MPERLTKSKRLEMLEKLRSQRIQNQAENEFSNDLTKLRQFRQKNTQCQRTMKRLEEKHALSLLIFQQMRYFKDVHLQVKDIAMIRRVALQQQIREMIARESQEIQQIPQRTGQSVNMHALMTLQRDYFEADSEIQSTQISLSQTYDVQAQLPGQQRIEESRRLRRRKQSLNYCETQSFSSSYCNRSQYVDQQPDSSINQQSRCECLSCLNALSECDRQSTFAFDAQSQSLFMESNIQSSFSALIQDQIIENLNQLCITLCDKSLEKFELLNRPQISTQCSQQIRFQTCMCEKCRQVKLPNQIYEGGTRY